MAVSRVMALAVPLMAEKEKTMSMLKSGLESGWVRLGNVRWGLIAALLGLPLPLVIIAFLFCGGCGPSR